MTADGGEPARPRRGRATPQNQQWLLALLPAFPLVLLVLRLWYASRQDTQTLQLLVQYVSPLGLLSSILITVVSAVPALVLALRALGTLFLVSTGTSSRLVRVADRLPDWVVALAAVVALLAWQLRFLPTLVMMVVAVAGLTVRERFPGHPTATRLACVVLPVVLAVVSYILLAPALIDAVHEGDDVMLVLLALPPGLGVLLTGPIPRAYAWIVTHGVAVALAALLPVVVGVTFLKVPILPLVAVEIAAKPGGREPAEIVVGYTIAVDDLMTTMLDGDGTVRFIRNDSMISKTLCPAPGDVPRSHVDLNGWYVEQSMISWLAPRLARTPDDPRCQGRRGTSA